MLPRRSIALLCAAGACALAACGEDDGAITLDRTDEVAPTAPTAPASPSADHDDRQSARALFADTCGSCHALKAAGTSTVVGPDLDKLKPTRAEVLTAIRIGPAIMPPNLLRGERARRVAAYIERTAGTR